MHPIWWARLDDIKNKSTWCPQCSYDSLKLSIEDAHIVAAERGGKCLSTSYEGIDHLLIWQCGKFHPPWITPLNNVRNKGSWCPYCNSSKGEERIAKILDELVLREYPAVYINPILGKKRYDFYLSTTNWLIEFDGKQHFKHIAYFNMGMSLEERQQSDQIKTMTALDAGYSILRIHHSDIDKIDSILSIVKIKQEIPILYLSRENVYNYLNIENNDIISYYNAKNFTYRTCPLFLTLNIINN